MVEVGGRPYREVEEVEVGRHRPFLEVAEVLEELPYQVVVVGAERQMRSQVLTD